MFYRIDREHKPTFKRDLSNLDLLGIRYFLNQLTGINGRKIYEYGTYTSSGNDGAALGLHWSLGTKYQLTIDAVTAYDAESDKKFYEAFTISYIKVSKEGALYLISESDDAEATYIKVDLGKYTY